MTRRSRSVSSDSLTSRDRTRDSGSSRNRRLAKILEARGRRRERTSSESMALSDVGRVSRKRGATSLDKPRKGGRVERVSRKRGASSLDKPRKATRIESSSDPDRGWKTEDLKSAFTKKLKNYIEQNPDSFSPGAREQWNRFGINSESDMRVIPVPPIVQDFLGLQSVRKGSKTHKKMLQVYNIFYNNR